MPDLARRLTVSSLIIGLLALLLVFCFHPLVQAVFFLLAMSLAAVGTWEMGVMRRHKEERISTRTQSHPFFEKRLVPLLSAVTILLYALSLQYPQNFPFYASLFFLLFPLFLFRFPEIDNSFSAIATAFFSICYVAIPISLFLGILYATPDQGGRLWVIYAIAVTKATDIGGYFIGNAFGRTALAPRISPKKTWEGAIGGTLVAVLVSSLFALLPAGFGGFSLSWKASLFLGLILAVMGQLGDLSESLLKRDARVKDSNQLPGLGGVLDFLDSLLFTFPVVFLFLHLP